MIEFCFQDNEVSFSSCCNFYSETISMPQWTLRGYYCRQVHQHLVVNTRFCLICLFQLERQGRIILKILIRQESILNLPQIRKILAIYPYRWRHYGFCLLPLRMATQWWCELHGNSKDPVLCWCEQWMSYSWAWSKAKECDHKLRLLPYFVLIGFFFFGGGFILFQCDDYPNTFFFQTSRNKNKLALMALCRSLRAGRCVWLWVQSEAQGVPARATALCPHRKRPRLLNDAGIIGPRRLT